MHHQLNTHEFTFHIVVIFILQTQDWTKVLTKIAMCFYRNLCAHIQTSYHTILMIAAKRKRKPLSDVCLAPNALVVTGYSSLCKRVFPAHKAPNLIVLLQAILKLFWPHALPGHNSDSKVAYFYPHHNLLLMIGHHKMLWASLIKVLSHFCNTYWSIFLMLDNGKGKGDKGKDVITTFQQPLLWERQEYILQHNVRQDALRAIKEVLGQ